MAVWALVQLTWRERKEDEPTQLEAVGVEAWIRYEETTEASMQRL